jgi:hypothetical protein
MNHIIINPIATTYFIMWNIDRSLLTGYGIVKSNQSMESGQPIMDLYLVESEWLNILLDNGVNPYVEDDDIQI